MTKIIIIIPARFKSSRFPGKPLKKILDKPMIIRVAEKCVKVVDKKNLFIATDDTRIARTAKKNGFNYKMTPASCRTGTDRVAYLSKKINSKIIINVQGDEPLIKPSDIKKIMQIRLY